MNEGVALQSDFDRHQGALYDRRWTWDDVPGYQPGQKLDISYWHDLDYLDVYDKVYGRRMGCNGIGKLREVALTRITDAENQLYDDRFAQLRDISFLEGHGLGQIPDIALCQQQQEQYAATLEANGVTVRWIEWGDYPVSAFGPMHRMWAPQELLVLNGGAVVPKLGWDPLSVGRAEWLSRWAFWNLNIPTILTISGKGVCEAGATVWLAQDVYVVGRSGAYNGDGLEQLLEVVRLTAGVPHLEVVTIRCQSSLYVDKQTGASAHVSNLVGPLDIDKVLCHSSGVDAETLLWLKRNGYQIIEADPDDQIRHVVCSLKILEPGHVILAAEAKDTIAMVRNAGVEVTEVPYSAFQDAGGGFHSSTMEIYREPGPCRFS